MTASIDRALLRGYRSALTGYPPAFKLEFADSMSADFADALRDARQAPQSRAVARLLLSVAVDLARSITYQWLRTSVPWLTAAYALAIACFCESLAAAMLRVPFDLRVVATLLPLVSAITYTCWFLVPHVRRRREHTICLKSVA